MSESDKGGPRSEAIAGKVEIEPRELRRILAHQFREEILGEVWSRVRRTFTLGGFISISVVLGFAAFLRGEIDSAATGAATTVARTEATQQVNLREDALRAAARDAARAEIRDNATDVERVKVELRNALAGLIDKALREDPFRGQIIEIVRPQLAQILQDDEWRRPIERAVFQQQALDTSRPVGARLFGFAAIVQERGGQAVALDILRTATERLQGAGASPNDIVFLRQAVATYAATLQPQPRAGAFREHEGILDALFDIAPAAGPEGSGFARLMREFDDPLAIAWLVRRIRQSSGEQRGVAIAALVSHSGQEARERVDTLLCSGEQELARAILQAYRSGQAAMTGDETGERFVRILNCSANYILAEYLPAVDERCLPGGDLLSFWRLSEYPDRNLRPEQQRRRNELVTSVAGRLRNIPDTCPPGLRGIAGSTPSFRQPLHWTALRQAPDDAPSPLLPYVALLRAPEGDDQPRWLSDLLRADGSLPALFADPSRHLVHIAVLLDRLATAPVAWGAAAAARDRLTATLVDMVGASPYRNQAERLLLAGMAGNAGPSFCGATLRAFGAKPHAALQAPAAFARSVRCALDPAEAPDVAALLQVMRGLAERAAIDREGPRRLFDLVAEARAPMSGAGASRRLADLFAWLIALPPAQAPDELLAEALGTLFTAADPLPFASRVEASEQGLRPMIEALAGRPSIQAQMRRILPYLAVDFAAAVPVAPERAEWPEGRSWTRLAVGDGQRVHLPVGAEHAVLIRLPAQAAGDAPPEARQLRRLAHGNESETLNPGQYFLGARMARDAAAPQLVPAPVAAPDATTFERAHAALETDRTWQGQIGREGRAYYPFPLLRGRSYVVETFRLARDLDTLVEVFGPDRSPLADDDDSGAELFASKLCFAAENDGMHWVGVRNYEGPPRAPLSFEFRVTTVPTCP